MHFTGLEPVDRNLNLSCILGCNYCACVDSLPAALNCILGCNSKGLKISRTWLYWHAGTFDVSACTGYFILSRGYCYRIIGGDYCHWMAIGTESVPIKSQTDYWHRSVAQWDTKLLLTLKMGGWPEHVMLHLSTRARADQPCTRIQVIQSCERWVLNFVSL